MTDAAKITCPNCAQEMRVDDMHGADVCTVELPDGRLVQFQTLRAGVMYLDDAGGPIIGAGQTIRTELTNPQP